jgi:hypothetical protein
MSLVGKKVRVTFNTEHWPVRYGRYTYQGYDSEGHWVVREDGFQRYLPNRLVVAIDPVDDTDIPEEEF